MAYNPTVFIDGQSPGISAYELNKIGNAIANIDKGYIRLLEDSQYISGSSYFVVGSGIDSSKTLVSCSLVFKKDIVTAKINMYYSQIIYLVPFADGNSIEGIFYIDKPDSSSTTKYLCKYYFTLSGGKILLYLMCDANLIGYDAVVIWNYKEV